MSEDAAAQGRRAKESTGPLMDTDKKRLGGDSFVQRTANPAWIKGREDIYATIKARRDEELASKKPVDITVTMPDGNVLSAKKDETPFQAWRTTPYDVAVVISQGLADSATVARVTYEKYADDYSPAEDGMEGEDTLMDAMADLSIDENKSEKAILWDMMRPLVGPVAKLELLKFDDDRDAKTVFWHSSAHMLGEALEHLYGCKLTIGPPLAGGFYYDSFMGKDAFKEEDCKQTMHSVRVASKKTCTRNLPPRPGSNTIYSFSLFFFKCFLQTNPSNKKWEKSPRKSKSLNAWSLPRKKHWNSLPTILSSLIS
jgi:threonyl-tRNA synthetase